MTVEGRLKRNRRGLCGGVVEMENAEPGVTRQLYKEVMDVCMATLVTCHDLDTSGVTTGPCLVISPIRENRADSFSLHQKPTYAREEASF